MDIVSTHRSVSISNNKRSSSSQQNHPSLKRQEVRKWSKMEVNRRNRRRRSGFDDGGIQVQIISTCNRSN
ncbi:hypothetical protein Hanom_Chr13g01203301 [Helianthus anomalus]